MSEPRKFPVWTIASLLAALAGNFVAAAFMIAPLSQLPPGSSVRLLAESFHAALATVATLAVVVILSVLAWRREGHRIASIIALCLALLSFPFSGWAMRHTAAARGISLKS
jgi:hypothetical protein